MVKYADEIGASNMQTKYREINKFQMKELLCYYIF